jgi:hypothetical protein
MLCTRPLVWLQLVWLQLCTCNSDRHRDRNRRKINRSSRCRCMGIVLCVLCLSCQEVPRLQYTADTSTRPQPFCCRRSNWASSYCAGEAAVAMVLNVELPRHVGCCCTPEVDTFMWVGIVGTWATATAVYVRGRRSSLCNSTSVDAAVAIGACSTHRSAKASTQFPGFAARLIAFFIAASPAESIAGRLLTASTHPVSSYDAIFPCAVWIISFCREMCPAEGLEEVCLRALSRCLWRSDQESVRQGRSPSWC